MPRSGKKAANAAQAQVVGAEDTVRALELRKSGKSYRAIAKEMGCATSHAHKLVMAALEELGKQASEGAKEVIQLESDRLDAMLAGVWKRAEEGDINAVYAALKISERRMRLLGIERERVEMSGPDGGPLEVDLSGYEKVLGILERYAPKSE